MRRYTYETVNVFSTERFGGNPLAVVLGAETLTSAEMQSLATEFNFSETTFVLPPEDQRNTARVRIFNRTAEMPFAGHPNVGTALVLASRGLPRGDLMRFEEMAGLVEIRLITEAGSGQLSARVVAPQPLSLGDHVPAIDVAGCVGLEAAQIIVSAHQPILASVGMPFVIAEVAPSALSQALPNTAAFRHALDTRPGFNGRFALFLYTRLADAVRARMFSPIAGTNEDPATGSASAALAALLLAHTQERQLSLTITQGIEMGRRSVLQVTSWRDGTDVRASVQGGCVHAARGAIEI